MWLLMLQNNFPLRPGALKVSFSSVWPRIAVVEVLVDVGICPWFVNLESVLMT